MPNMLIRNMPAETRDAIVRAAQGRGLTLAEYFTALYKLHTAVRMRADHTPDDGLQAELMALGLQTLTM